MSDIKHRPELTNVSQSDWVTIQQENAGLGEEKRVRIASLFGLIPSGNDDSLQITIAALLNRGLVRLAPGIFKIKNPLILEGSVRWRDAGNGSTAYYGVKLIGAGSGATIIDTSEIDPETLRVHDTYKIIGITNASPAVVTLDPSTPLPSGANWEKGELRAINGTRIYLQTPATTQVTSTMEALNGICSAAAAIYLKKLTTTTAELYADAALTVPVNTSDTTLFGQYGTATVTEYSTTWNTSIAWKMRRYFGNYNYIPCVRMLPPVISGTQRGHQMAPMTQGITFRNLTPNAHANGQEYNGICLAVENNLTSGTGGNADTITSQGFGAYDTKFEGYECPVLLDDSTNNTFERAEFQGNPFAVWAGYNFDITKFTQCRFGDDRFVAGVRRQQVCMIAPVYYAPQSTYIPAPSQCTGLTFDSNWFMGVHDVIGDLNPQSTILSGTNYFEQARTVGMNGGGRVLAVRGCHFTGFEFGKNLKNNETVFGDYTEQVFESNEADNEPQFGYARVVHNNSIETNCTKLSWRANRLPAPAPTANKQDRGHIKYNVFDGSSSAAPRYICLYDDVVSGSDRRLGRGEFSFLGADQMSGDDRVYHNTAAIGNIDPVPENFTLYELTLTGNITIRNPCSSIDVNAGSGRSWQQQHQSGTHKRALRMKPLRFILTQGGSGNYTVSFGSEFAVPGFVDGASAAVGTKTMLEFAWDGSKWRIKSANAWA